ncbi:MAG: recX [Firmicutes bacterium]|nr:recX [Bacillota bacterium]
MNEQIVEGAIKLLKIRNYSRHELVRKLLTQGYEEAAVREAVEYVAKRGYLNDAALCDMLLERYADNGKYSVQEIYFRLKNRGLSTSLINEKLENWDVDLEYQAAVKIVKKCLDSKDKQDLHKIVRRLSRKGFKAVTVSKVLAQLQDLSP